jgi:hypothetical protein
VASNFLTTVPAGTSDVTAHPKPPPCFNTHGFAHLSSFIVSSVTGTIIWPKGRSLGNAHQAVCLCPPDVRNCFAVFFLQCHYVSLMDFVVSLSGCGRSVTDVWGWDAHEAQLRCPDEVDGDIIPGGALNLNSSKLPRPWSPWESSPSRGNPHGRTGNRIRDLMTSSQKLWPLDHDAVLLFAI